MFKSLKTNPTPFEKHLEQVNAELRDYAPDYTALADPERCPLSFLPFLAWALSVDYWDESWTENIKREVCKQSIQIHREKGTIKSIKRTLSAVGIIANVNESKDTPKLAPHAFEIFASVSENLSKEGQSILSPTTYTLLSAMIDQVKPVRSYCEFYIGATFPANLDMAYVAHGHAITQQTAKAIPPKFSLASQWAFVGNGQAIKQATAQIKKPELTPNIHLVFASNAISLCQFTMESA